MAKKKRIKKAKNNYSSQEFPPVFMPDGGFLAGDLGTSGIQNDELNKRHRYLNSGERTLAGIAQGLASAVGLGGLVQSSLDHMGVTDQLNRSKEYKNAAGISGGLASF